VKLPKTLDGRVAQELSVSWFWRPGVGCLK